MTNRWQRVKRWIPLIVALITITWGGSSKWQDHRDFQAEMAEHVVRISFDETGIEGGHDHPLPYVETPIVIPGDQLDTLLADRGLSDDLAGLVALLRWEPESYQWLFGNRANDQQALMAMSQRVAVGAASEARVTIQRDASENIELVQVRTPGFLIRYRDGPEGLEGHLHGLREVPTPEEESRIQAGEAE